MTTANRKVSMLKPTTPPPEAAVVAPVEPFECPHCRQPYAGAGGSVPALLVHTRCTHCARPFLVPGRLDDLVLVERIKSGGSGSLYRAHDAQAGRDVAVRVLPASATPDAAAVERVRLYVRLLASLHHPHLARVLDCRVSRGVCFLVQELMTADSLARRLETQPLPERDALNMARDIADALAAIHAAGLVHGHVTPSSIVLREDGAAMLANPGMLGAPRRDSRGAVLGTPLFIATEVLKGAPDSPRSDLYSLGVTLYQALTGKPPFEGRTLDELLKAQMLGVSFPVGAHVTTLSPATRALVQHAMKRNPDERPPDSRSFVREIDAALQALAPPAPAPLPAAAPPTQPRHHVRPSILLLAAAAVAILTCGWAIFDWLLDRDAGPHGSAELAPADPVLAGRAFGQPSAAAVAACQVPVKPAWQDSFLGSAALRGSVLWGRGGVSLAGEGAHVLGTSDDARFLNLRLSPPYRFTLAVTSLAGGDKDAACGLLARAGTAPDMPAVFLGCQPDGTLRMQVRARPHRSAEEIGTVPAPPGGWRAVSLRLECSQDRYRGSYSLDRTNWTVVSSCRAEIPARQSRVGIAIASGAAGTLATAEIGEILVLVPPPTNP
jgi:serine/threonine-protein kinase